MNGWVLFFHLLGACVWVGGHLYLVATVLPNAMRQQSSEPILAFEASFEKLGMTALLTQVVTGGYMVSRFLPNMAFLTDWKNPIAILVLMKISWLILSVLTALSAQLWVIPNVRKDPQNARLRNIFIGHILTIMTLALAFVATGVLFRTGF